MSDNVVDFPNEPARRIVENLSAMRAPPYGGGGGGDGTMERLAVVEAKLTGVEGRMDRLEGRMDRLEGRMDAVDARLRGVEVGLATLTERVSHLPSKGFIVGALATSVGVVSGLALFLDRLRTLLGL